MAKTQQKIDLLKNVCILFVRRYGNAHAIYNSTSISC